MAKKHSKLQHTSHERVNEIGAVITQACNARALAPHALWAAVLARVSITAPMAWRTPDIGLGKPSVPSLYVAVVGPSGDGKSQTIEAAADLVPFPSFEDSAEVTYAAPASGQALMSKLRGRPSWEDAEGTPCAAGDEGARKVYRDPCERLFVTVDEGGKLWADAAREGSSLGETLKSAWFSARLANETKSVDEWLEVDAQRYRLSMLAGAVPSVLERIASLDSGFLQRLLVITTRWDRAEFVPERGVKFPETALEPQWKPYVMGRSRASEAVAYSLWDRMMAAREGAVMLPEPWEGVRHPWDAHQGLMQLRIASCVSALGGGMGDVDDVAWQAAGRLIRESAIALERIGRGVASPRLAASPQDALLERCIRVLVSRCEPDEDGNWAMEPLTAAELRSSIRLNASAEALVTEGYDDKDAYKWACAMLDAARGGPLVERGTNRKGNPVYGLSGDARAHGPEAVWRRKLAKDAGGSA